jgi:CHAT domain-containing protein
LGAPFLKLCFPGTGDGSRKGSTKQSFGRDRTAAELRYEEKLRQLIDIMGPQKAILDQAGRLAESLLASFAPIAEATAMLLIAPDGLITLAPFDVLLDAEIGLEKAPLTSFLVTGRGLLRKPEPARNGGIAVFANADYGTVKPGCSAPLPDDAFQPLAGTEHEAAAVQALFPDARVITAGDATADAFRTVDAPLILHVATHGFFSPRPTP